jgi:Mg-chelatase subunit ChlD
MKQLLFLWLLFPATILRAQLQYSKTIDLGTITEAYQIQGDVVFKNTGATKIYLMRADADAGVKIYTSKKTLLPGDTCLLVISFIPENKGTFYKQIRIVSSDKNEPNILALKGNLNRLKTDDKLSCFYFGNRRNSPVPVKQEPIVIAPNEEKRDVSNRIPDKTNSPSPVTKATAPKPVTKKEEQKDPPVINNSQFSEEEFKPNNIIFLVDISGSMKDSLKLPVMKSALHFLIDEIRLIDKITFITYADTIKTLTEAATAGDRSSLHKIVDGLKAKGMTKGRKAILYSQAVAQKNYIDTGNNEIIIATDGKFRFEKEDQKLWNERQGEKKVILTTVVFGDDKEAISNLKDLARKGKGSFIHIKERNGSQDKLLEEIKFRSKK